MVEAKVAWKTAGEGMQQAKEYAEMLGLKFAYSTNGQEILEFDYWRAAARCATVRRSHELRARSSFRPGLDSGTMQQLMSTVRKS